MTEAYDKKNAEDFEVNTTLIVEAIEQISRDDSLKVTISQIAKITGLHRNTISERGWPKDRLEEIKTLRAKEAKREKKTPNTESQVKVLEEKLENAFKELVFWFRKYQKIENDYKQLLTNYQRMTDSKNMYQEYLLAEKKHTEKLQKQVDLLTKSLNV